jgi:TPP-dependent 2-oxoacid decarboxylase
MIKAANYKTGKDVMQRTTVGRYLIKRLEQAGIRHLFGVPGDYVLDFMDLVVDSSITLVGNCNELNAGYAADAYARLNGIGATCVTYGVGGLSTLNSAAGAYAEEVPVVYISGAPSSAQRLSNTHMHHTVTSYDMQWDIFRKITIDSVQLTNPHSAPDEIDRVISNCVSERLPVYIEIPVDMVAAPCRPPTPLAIADTHTSEPGALEECVQETLALLASAQNPVILAGVEVHRFNLADKLLRLVEKLDIAFATTIDGKSVLPEKHPLFMGIYMGALSREEVRTKLENSDGLLSFGSMTTDINSGGFTAQLPQHRMISAHKNRVRIGRHYYDRVWLGDYLDALTQALKPHDYTATHHVDPHGPRDDYEVRPDAALRVPRFYDRLNRFIESEMILVAETGDAMFAASELYVSEPENFVSQAYYLSIGYALPATLGVSLARPDKRVVLLQGDGSFQMTAQELSTLLHYNCHPVIFILNNDGYVIERLIHDGPYNDIPQWNYHLLPRAFGGDALCHEVKTEGELEDALASAGTNRDKLVFINLHLPPNEGSDAVARLCKALRKLQTGE